MSTRDSGLMIRHMATVPISMLMEQLMLENGTKINSKERELKNGQMVPGTRGCTEMERSTETDASHSQMAAPTRATSVIMRFQVLVNTFGQTARSLKVSGRKIKCTDKAYWSGKMVRDTKDNSASISERAEELSGGGMEESTKENGWTVSSTE